MLFHSDVFVCLREKQKCKGVLIMLFSECLIKLIGKEDITQTELSNRTGIARGCISRYISKNGNEPPVDKAIKLLNALGYKVLLVKDKEIIELGGEENIE